MTKTDLVNALANKLSTPKAQVARMLDAVISEVSLALAKGSKVQIAGLGVFDVKKRASRPGRNPRTGKVINIAARNAVRFRSANSLKEAVNK